MSQKRKHCYIVTIQTLAQADLGELTHIYRASFSSDKKLSFTHDVLKDVFKDVLPDIVKEIREQNEDAKINDIHSEITAVSYLGKLTKEKAEFPSFTAKGLAKLHSYFDAKKKQLLN